MAIHDYLIEHRGKTQGGLETRLSPVASILVITGFSALCWVGMVAVVRELSTLL
jgi:hypothetical protein